MAIEKWELMMEVWGGFLFSFYGSLSFLPGISVVVWVFSLARSQ